MIFLLPRWDMLVPWVVYFPCFFSRNMFETHISQQSNVNPQMSNPYFKGIPGKVINVYYSLLLVLLYNKTRPYPWNSIGMWVYKFWVVIAELLFGTILHLWIRSLVNTSDVHDPCPIVMDLLNNRMSMPQHLTVSRAWGIGWISTCSKFARFRSLHFCTPKTEVLCLSGSQQKGSAKICKQ